MEGRHILLGVSGGIAAYKTPDLVRQLKKTGAEVQVLMTPYAYHFVSHLSLATVSENPVFSEFYNQQTGEWVNHVDFANWADAYLIAPLTSNTLAKLTYGFCDNLVLATYLSATCPVLVAPAMDRDMYQHSTVQYNLRTLEARGHQIIGPEEGSLASGLEGKGRMTEPEDLTNTLKSQF
jgi:phosphopantothenoylcysteine decarboxylase/phosphopantothenate--cysteine ligase